MTNLEVVAQGTNDAMRRLGAYGDSLNDFYRFWPLVAEAFTRREDIFFEREGEGSWPPLSQAYAQWKAIAYPGKPLLVRTGTLKQSLTDPTEAVLAMTPRELWLGSDVEYARYHLHGTERMPARRPLIPVLRLAGAIANLVQRHIMYPPRFR
jgi:phage gpG-like protein